MKFSRRDILKYMAAGCAATITPTFAFSGFDTNGLIKSGDYFYSNESDLPDLEVYFSSMKNKISVVNFGKGTYKTFPDERIINSGHSFEHLPDGRILQVTQWNPRIFIISPEKEYMETIVSPIPDYGFSGHCLPLASKGVVMFPLQNISGIFKRNNTEYIKSKLAICDIKNLKTLEITELTSPYPHDIKPLPDGKNAVVSFYGKDLKKGKNGIFLNNVIDTRMSLIDLNTGKSEKHYIPNSKLTEQQQMSHVVINDSGVAYVGMLQKMNVEKRSFELMDKTFGKHDWPNTPDEENQMAYPNPLLQINLTNGEIKEFFGNPMHHMRHQSIDMNRKNNKVFCTYKYSNYIATVKDDSIFETTWMKPFGIDNVSGVSDITGTDYIALSGIKNNVQLFNSNTMKKIAEFRVETGSLHLSSKKS